MKATWPRSKCQIEMDLSNFTSNDCALTMTEAPLEILYRDESIIAVNKPEGLLVHRSNIDKYESRFLLQILRDQIGQYLYPIHRLDKPTSGIILFAFSSDIAAAMQKLMEENQASKEYLLVCRGYCPTDGEIDYPLKPVDEFKKNKKEMLKKL